METMHDPIEIDGVVDNHPEISNNSFISQSVFDTKGNLLRKDQFNSRGNREWRTIFKPINSIILQKAQPITLKKQLPVSGYINITPPINYLRVMRLMRRKKYRTGDCSIG